MLSEAIKKIRTFNIFFDTSLFLIQFGGLLQACIEGLGKSWASARYANELAKNLECQIFGFFNDPARR
jgi:hypothetical protein